MYAFISGVIWLAISSYMYGVNVSKVTPCKKDVCLCIQGFGVDKHVTIEYTFSFD